jgi:YD repeat-containing protein
LKSYKIVANGSAWSGSGSMNLSRGKGYRAGAWIKGDKPIYLKLQATDTGNDVAVGSYSGSGKWEYVEIEGTVPAGTGATADIRIKFESSISGTFYFDEVRLCPSDALMETYTYDPASFNLIAKTDANGKVTRYEYDASGRLARVINANGKVIKENAYHFSGQ